MTFEALSKTPKIGCYVLIEPTIAVVGGDEEPVKTFLKNHIGVIDHITYSTSKPLYFINYPDDQEFCRYQYQFDHDFDVKPPHTYLKVTINDIKIWAKEKRTLVAYLKGRTFDL